MLNFRAKSSNRLKTTGTRNRVTKVAASKPPITTVASGAFISAPSPNPITNGSMAKIVAKAVIRIGRSLTHGFDRLRFVPYRFQRCGVIDVHNRIGRQSQQHNDPDKGGNTEGASVKSKASKINDRARQEKQESQMGL